MAHSLVTSDKLNDSHITDDQYVVAIVEDDEDRDHYKEGLSHNVSSGTLDSGMGSREHSRNPSSASLNVLDISHTHNHFESIANGLPPIIDKEYSLPRIEIDRVPSDEYRDREEKKQDNVVAITPTEQTDWKLLNINSRSRKGSDTSTTSIASSSLEYVTAPTSPELTTLTRSMSLDSISSLPQRSSAPLPTSATYSSPEMIAHIERALDSISVTINLPSTNEKTELTEFKNFINLDSKKTICVDFQIRPHSLVISRRPSVSSPQCSPCNSPCDHISIKLSKGSPQLHRTMFTHDDELTSSHHIRENERIKNIVRKNVAEFGQSTNLDALYPHLFATNLISTSDFEELQGISNSHGKMNLFYIMLLPKKGKQAYEKLFECLKRETTHRGHYDLVRMIQTGLQ